MARIFPDVAGAITGRIGQMAYFMKGGENHNRRLAVQVKATEDRSVLEQRLKFKVLSALATHLTRSNRLGFPKRPKTWTPNNTFMSCNLDAVTVKDLEAGAAEVSYEGLLLADGDLRGPKLTVSYTEESHSLAFTVTANVKEGWGFEDDEVYATIVDGETGICQLEKLGNRGDGGMVTVELPEEWSKDNVHVYAFATTAKHTMASRSKHLPLA